MRQLQTFNSNNQAVAFGIRKKRGLTIDEKLDLIIERLDKIEARLDKHDELFRQHGWIK